MAERQSEKALEMWVFTEVDLARLADDIGAAGIRVEKPSDFGPALEKALTLDRPVVLDVVTDIDALAPLAVV
jgi:acetolactate synthase-1/2/3 large subunit